MKLFKQLAAATMASVLSVLAPAAAYADPLPTPASIKGVLINQESEVPKAAELGVSQVITNFPISWVYQPGMIMAYESYLRALNKANISVTVIVLNDLDVYFYKPDLLPLSPPETNTSGLPSVSPTGTDNLGALSVSPTGADNPGLLFSTQPEANIPSPFFSTQPDADMPSPFFSIQPDAGIPGFLFGPQPDAGIPGYLYDTQPVANDPSLLPVTPPEANYYAFNTLTEAGLAATLDAANRVAENFGGLVSNWVIGNEINDGQVWNYIGPMDVNTYCAHYALAFRTWYSALKNANSSANIYIPFDFRWNTGHLEGLKYGVMDMLPLLNTMLQDTDYGIAWHAYPEEFDSPVFLDDRNALEQINTPIINLKNLHVLTDYMSQPGMLSPTGTVRHLILSEQGFTSLSPAHGGDCQELQAQCIVQAYQAAAANPYVEAFMLNRLFDVPSMLEQNYAFGLVDVNGMEKLSWEAYKALP